jgi:hypothetical protein
MKICPVSNRRYFETRLIYVINSCLEINVGWIVGWIVFESAGLETVTSKSKGVFQCSSPISVVFLTTLKKFQARAFFVLFFLLTKKKEFVIEAAKYCSILAISGFMYNA